jgi:hypothetical protein
MAEFISAEVEQLVRPFVDGESFRNTNDVLLAALELFNQYKAHEQLRADVRAGFDEIERGEFVELADDSAMHAFFDDIKRRGRAHLAASQDE